MPDWFKIKQIQMLETYKNANPIKPSEMITTRRFRNISTTGAVKIGNTLVSVKDIFVLGRPKLSPFSLYIQENSSVTIFRNPNSPNISLGVIMGSELDETAAPYPALNPANAIYWMQTSASMQGSTTNPTNTTESTAQVETDEEHGIIYKSWFSDLWTMHLLIHHIRFPVYIGFRANNRSEGTYGATYTQSSMTIQSALIPDDPNSLTFNPPSSSRNPHQTPIGSQVGAQPPTPGELRVYFKISKTDDNITSVAIRNNIAFYPTNDAFIPR